MVFSLNKNLLLRLSAMVVLLVGLWWLTRATGLFDELSAEAVEQRISSYGAVGFVVYLVVFALALLAQLPGWVFIGAGALAYGPVYGFPAALVGATAAATVGFLFARFVGGDALGQIERPFVRRWLRKIDEAPIRTVIVLRLLTMVSPPVNYLLGMTRLRFRDYVVGSVAGLAVPVFVTTRIVACL